MKIETKEQPAAFEEDNINLLHVLLFYDPIPLCLFYYCTKHQLLSRH